MTEEDYFEPFFSMGCDHQMLSEALSKFVERVAAWSGKFLVVESVWSDLWRRGDEM